MTKVYFLEGQEDNYTSDLSELKSKILAESALINEYDTVPVMEAELQEPYKLSDFVDLGQMFEEALVNMEDLMGEDDQNTAFMQGLITDESSQKAIYEALNAIKGMPEIRTLRNIKKIFVQIT